MTILEEKSKWYSIRAARTAHNPKTLEEIQVPAKQTMKFKMGRIMREGMNDHTTE